jgi:hypothetical protein
MTAGTEIVAGSAATANCGMIRLPNVSREAAV